MLELYRKTNYECSKIITKNYSTSFSLGILAFDKKFRDPIYGIYSYVRYADEIVDTFHDFNKLDLFKKFREETFRAIEDKISLSPVLDTFQDVVNTYHIDIDLIDAFLNSMEMDLYQNQYSEKGYTDYIYGSAEVVGLMCLKVFCENNQDLYNSLESPARALGSAFQKVNFLRDLKDDFQGKGRTYFPGVNFNSNFTNDTKKLIETDIQKDFDHAMEGISNLPTGAKLGVYLAYQLYISLFNRLKKADAHQVMKERIRVPDSEKISMIPMAYVKTRFNFI